MAWSPFAKAPAPSPVAEALRKAPAFLPFFSPLLVAEEGVMVCEPGFLPFYDNDGNLLECISTKAGSECFVSDEGGDHGGVYNDRGDCVQLDTSHIRSKEEAEDYCIHFHGRGSEGFLTPDGEFWGCCPRGQIVDPETDDCACPKGTSWDSTEHECRAMDGEEFVDPPPVAAKPSCIALYGKDHYATWSEADGAWACFACRPDERGDEDGLCYCAPGSRRRDPSYPDSPCVAVTAPTTPTSPSTSTKDEANPIWPWLLGGGALAAVATAVYLHRARVGADDTPRLGA